MANVHILLVILALVAFLLAAVEVTRPKGMLALGLFLWLLSTLVGGPK